MFAMLMLFLTGAAGAACFVAAFLAMRERRWSRTLNDVWPLTRSLVFNAKGATDDNLSVAIALHALNLSPGTITIGALEEVTIKIRGVHVSGQTVQVLQPTVGAVLTPTVSHQISFAIADAPDPIRGTISLRTKLCRVFSEDVIKTFEVDFVVEKAQPGFRVGGG